MQQTRSVEATGHTTPNTKNRARQIDVGPQQDAQRKTWQRDYRWPPRLGVNREPHLPAQGEQTQNPEVRKQSIAAGHYSSMLRMTRHSCSDHYWQRLPTATDELRSAQIEEQIARHDRPT